jgi:cytochrome c556
MLKSVRVLVAMLALVVSASSAFAQKPGVGTWDLTTISPEGEFKSTLVVREEGGKLIAVGKSAQGERPYDSVAVEGSKITLVVTISYNGSPMTITYNGTVDKDKMGGEADYGGLATGTWSATAQK